MELWIFLGIRYRIWSCFEELGKNKGQLVGNYAKIRYNTGVTGFWWLYL